MARKTLLMDDVLYFIQTQKRVEASEIRRNLFCKDK